MADPRVIPALADLTQDIAGPIPVELLHNWAGGVQDLATAEGLLRSFEIEGTVVATDSSGLTKRTGEEDLLDVLALVSRPKEIVHALGVEIGGRPIGVWVADNSQMHYPAPVPAETILDALLEANLRIAGEVPIQVGMAVHTGRFYEIGGGLYGQDSRTVEWLAEEFAAGGEILITREIRDQLRGIAGFRFKNRSNLEGIHGAAAYSLLSERRMPRLEGKNRAYPHPYSAEFFKLFLDFLAEGCPDELRQRIYSTYYRERAVVFLANRRPRRLTADLADLLDRLLNAALFETVLHEIPGSFQGLAGVGGGVAILTFATVKEALDFALQIREMYRLNALDVSIGIDQGYMLMFEQQHTGPGGITGGPINIASKISEDAGNSGDIRITARAAARMKSPPPGEPFEIFISHVRITGLTL